MRARHAFQRGGIGMDPMTKVSIRDFAIFQTKLLLDGLKDGAVFATSFVAFGLDLVFRRHGTSRQRRGWALRGE